MTIIGNLTADPQTNTTANGKSVCNFTVACNRPRRQDQQNSNQPEADFFRVSVWNENLAKSCQKYLTKGRKVCVIGPVSVNTYTGQDGSARASMNVQAIDVEFLSSGNNAQAVSTQQNSAPAADPGVNMTPVDPGDELPFDSGLAYP